MMKILKANDISLELLRATEAMYTNTRAVVVTLDGENQDLTSSQGLYRGDTLALYLFITALVSSTLDLI